MLSELLPLLTIAGVGTILALAMWFGREVGKAKSDMAAKRQIEKSIKNLETAQKVEHETARVDYDVAIKRLRDRWWRG